MIQPPILRNIIDQHAEEASFLWTLRDRAASGLTYTLDALADLDERVEAHLDGLRIGGEHAWEACADVLPMDSAGDIFVVSALALHEGEDEKLAAVLDAAGLEPELARGIISAIGWTRIDRIGGALAAFLDSDGPPELQLLGLAGASLHRLPLGPTLQQALFSADNKLLARALRTAGELGRTDLQPYFAQHAGNADPEVRFWAAWAAVLLGNSGAAATLWSTPEDSRRASRAYTLAARVTPPAIARARLEALGDPRLRIAGLTALGDPGSMGGLFEALRDPELARLAAHGIAAITGLEIRSPALRGAAPEGFRSGPTDDPKDENVSMDPDEQLAWPNPDAVEAAVRRLGLASGVRHLAGQPIQDGSTAQVLRHGTQSQRGAAAIERCLVSPSEPLVEVRAPGFRQLERAGQGAPATLEVQL